MSTLRFDTWTNRAGTEEYFKCRAWVNFNGTGTVAIRAAGNVSSITDNGVGDYTVNFTNAMPDANYAAVMNGPTIDGVDTASTGAVSVVNKTTSNFRVDTETGNATPAQADFASIDVAIFR